jgi:hypothetical protein
MTQQSSALPIKLRVKVPLTAKIVQISFSQIHKNYAVLKGHSRDRFSRNFLFFTVLFKFYQIRTQVKNHAYNYALTNGNALLIAEVVRTFHTFII